MRIVFENKKSEKEVLEESKKIMELNKIDFEGDSSVLIKGDNFVAMSVLLEQFRGKVDLIYTDPPFNTNQTFFGGCGRANTISKSKNGICAYIDKQSIDGYFAFIRERLILMRELLSEMGSIYLHIDYKMGHYVKAIMDEVFGEKNFKNDITRIKSNPKNFYRKAYGNEKDMILFYTKSDKSIWNDIKVPLNSEEIKKRFPKIDANGRRYTTIPLHAPGETTKGVTGQTWRGIPAPEGRHWRTNPEEFEKLDLLGRIEWSSNGNPRIKKYADEHLGKKMQDVWVFKDPQKPIYPTEKNKDMIERIIRQSSDQNSLILDCFAGSGATLKCAEELGRKWIGIDCSDLSINTIKSGNLKNYQYFEI